MAITTDKLIEMYKENLFTTAQALVSSRAYGNKEREWQKVGETNIIVQILKILGVSDSEILEIETAGMMVIPHPPVGSTARPLETSDISPEQEQELYEMDLDANPVAELRNGYVQFNYGTQKYTVVENGKTRPATREDFIGATWYSEDEREVALA
jgi:hypothetical protein